MRFGGSLGLAAFGLLVITACGQEPGDAANPAGGEAPVSAVAAPGESGAAEASDGEGLYRARCAACHGTADSPGSDTVNNRALPWDVLQRLNPAHLMFAMSNGPMKTQVEGLRTDELIDIVAFVTGDRAPYQPAAENFCEDSVPAMDIATGEWAENAVNTGSLAAGQAALTSTNVDSLRLAWAFGLPDVANARSRPAATSDTLFVAATSGHLFALDQTSGCIRWHATAPAAPRTSLLLSAIGDRTTLFFGDIEAHVNAVDPQDGTLLWRADASVAEHSFLTGAQKLHGDTLIVPVSLYEVGLAGDPEYECCVSHGGVVAFDALTGERRWTRHLTEEATPQGVTEAGTRSWGPSGVPVWSTPTIDADRGLVYVGTGQNASLPPTEYSDAVIALRLDTGEIAWHFQTIAGDAYNMACDQRPPGPNCPKWRGPDHDIGAAVVLTRNSQGEERLIVGQKSGDLYALDPDRAGAVVWQTRVGAGSPLGGIHWGMSVADGVIYAPVADPPYPIPGYRPAPGLYAVSVDDGRLLWKQPVERGCEINLFEYLGRADLYPDCSFFFGLSAAPLAVNDVLVAGALDGRLRIWDRSDGRELWTTDTALPMDTINGVPAHGGAIDVAPPVAVGNRLFLQSGYAQFGQLPGNLLLAFELPGPQSRSSDSD